MAEFATHAVFSVLKNVLPEDELLPTEFDESRPKDDYIDHDLLRRWFVQRLIVCNDHRMSLREIWRNFCYEHNLYCSLPLFGNVVYRHVLQDSPEWAEVTKTGDIKQKRYNLAWAHGPVPDEKLDLFFSKIKEEKEKVDKKATSATPSPSNSATSLVEISSSPTPSSSIKNPTFLNPEVLAEWWESRLEPTEPNNCRMRMKDVYDRFVLETDVMMPKALFGELSVRYVLSKSRFASVVRRGKVHNKRYSLQWKDDHTTTKTPTIAQINSLLPRSSSLSPLSSRSQSPLSSPTLSPSSSFTSSPVNSPPISRRATYEDNYPSEPFATFSAPSNTSYFWPTMDHSPKEKSHFSFLFNTTNSSSNSKTVMVGQC